MSSARQILPTDQLAMGVTLARTPEAVLVSRGVTVLFGLGAVAWLYALGKRLTGRAAVGLLAALLLALSPSAIKINRFITPDSFVVFFVLGTAWFSLGILQHGRTRDYLLAGLFAGLAVSSKYNAALVVVLPLAAHFIRHGWEGLVTGDIYKAMMVCGLAFLLTTPFALLDANQFIDDVQYEMQHYASGHPGMEGDSLSWYLRYLWQVEGPLMLLGAAALAVKCAQALPVVWRSWGKPFQTDQARRAAWLAAALFPLVYFVFISRYVVRNDRTLLPVIPFLLLFAAAALVELAQAAQRPARRLGRGLAWAGVSLLALLSLALPVLTLVEYLPALRAAVPEQQAREWVQANLPAGTTIALESYSPYLDARQYRLQPMYRIIDHDLGWYRQQHIQYIIFADAMYGRFYIDPLRYYAEKSQYERLFRALKPAAVFQNTYQAGLGGRLARWLSGQERALVWSGFLYTHTVQIYQVP